MFSVHITQHKNENAKITNQFGFDFAGYSGSEIIVFQKLSKMFSSILKRKVRVFKFLRFDERFRISTAHFLTN